MNKKTLPALTFIVLIISVLATYSQVYYHDFIGFDDPTYITENIHVNRGFSIDNVIWAFSVSGYEYWHPLTWLSHMLDCELFGLNPGVHHIVNVFIHVMNVILLFFTLFKMTDSFWKSLLVAGLFALHPINVDSVAWLAERKNVLSTSFWMLTLLGYFFYVKKKTVSTYLLTLVAFILGLLSKPMLVTIPLIFILLDFWPLKRVTFERVPGKSGGQIIRFHDSGPAKIFFEKIPFIFFSFISILISYASIRKGGFHITHEMVPMGLRISNAIVSYVTYLWKMILPFNLTFFYPYPEAIPFWQVVGSLLVLVVITTAALTLLVRSPYFFVGWLWYLVTLIPVSGIMQGGLWPAIAERWAYVPLIGIFIASVWGMTDLMAHFPQKEKILAIASIMILACYIYITSTQIGFWKNDISLFEHGIKVNSRNFVAHNNLGMALMDKGDVGGAIFHFKSCMQIHSLYPNAYINLGDALSEKRSYKEAYLYLLKGIEIDPKNPDIHAGIGTVLTRMGKIEEAEKHFIEALEIDPTSVKVLNNLGNLMLRTGKVDRAIVYYSNALKNNPFQAEIYNNLGTASIHKGNLEEAKTFFYKAITLHPEYEEAIHNYKNVTEKLMKIDATIHEMLDKMQANPNDTGTLVILGKLSRQKGDYRNAIDYFNNSLILQPDSLSTMNCLVEVYSKTSEYEKALDILMRMKERYPEKPTIYYNIACIYARMSRYEDSIRYLNEAVSKGFHETELLMNDPDLDNMRSKENFKRLLRVLQSDKN